MKHTHGSRKTSPVAVESRIFVTSREGSERWNEGWQKIRRVAGSDPEGREEWEGGKLERSTH